MLLFSNSPVLCSVIMLEHSAMYLNVTPPYEDDNTFLPDFYTRWVHLPPLPPFSSSSRRRAFGVASCALVAFGEFSTRRLGPVPGDVGPASACTSSLLLPDENGFQRNSTCGSPLPHSQLRLSVPYLRRRKITAALRCFCSYATFVYL